MATILFTAAQVPVLQTFSGYQDIATGSPPTASFFAPGTVTISTPMKKNANRLDANAANGGAGRLYAVASGLDLDSGANLTQGLSAGQAMMPGSCPETAAAVTAAATPSIARICWWANRAGALVSVNNSLVPPAGANVYLGSNVSGSGSRGTADYSGRPQLVGRDVFVQVADVGVPGQIGGANPTGVTFYVRSATGLYWWDGTAYHATDAGLPLIPESVPTGTTLVIPAGYQVQVRDRFSCVGVGTQFIVQGRAYVTGG